MNKKLKKKIWISLGALVVVGAAVTASLVTLKSCNNNKNINLSYEISNPTNPNEKNVLKYGSELTITITQKNVLGDIVWTHQEHSKIIYSEGGENNSVLTLQNNNDSQEDISLQGIVATDQKGESITIDGITCKHHIAAEVKAIDGSDWDGWISGELYYFIDDDAGEIYYIGNDGYKAENLIIPDEVHDESGENVYKVVRIGVACFSNCELSGDLTIGNNVRNIDKYSFAECNQLDGCLYIPASLENIWVNAFLHTNNFTDIIVSNQSETYTLATNVGSAKALIRNFGEPVIDYSAEQLIGDDTSICALIVGDVTIPDGVTEIKENFFAGADGITSFILPAFLTTIGDNAFSDCGNLGSLSIPASVNSIGDYAFHGSYFSDVNLNGNTHFCFANNVGGASILLPVGTQSYDYSANSDQVVGKLAFGNLVVDGQITVLGGSCFYQLPGLSSISLPQGLQTIGEQAFSGCGDLTGVLSIPTDVDSIGTEAFAGCNFSDVNLNGNANFHFADNVGDAKILLPVGTQSYDYSSTSAQISGKLAIGELGIPDDAPPFAIGVSAFDGCTGLSGELVIPDNVTSIGNFAFKSCENITALSFEEGVQTVGRQAFRECANLRNALTIPNTVTSMGITGDQNGVFDSTNIPSIAFGSGMSTITSNFVGGGVENISLRKVELSSTITTINNTAFDLCFALNNVSFNDELVSVGDFAFAGAPLCGDFNIPKKLTTIGLEAFCSALFTNINTGENEFFKLATNVGNATVLMKNSETYDFAANGEDTGKEFQTAGYICYGNITIPDGTTALAGWDFFQYDGGPMENYRSFSYIVGDFDIPEGVSTIKGNAFCWAKVNELTIPDSVTAIEENAFSTFSAKNVNCSGAGHYRLAKNVGEAKILLHETDVFDYTKGVIEQVPSSFGFGEITIPDGTTEIGDYVFYTFSLTGTITFPSSVTKIGQRIIDSEGYDFVLNHNLTTVIFETQHTVDIAVNFLQQILWVNEIYFNFNSQPTKIQEGAFNSIGVAGYMYKQRTCSIKNESSSYSTSNLLAYLKGEPSLPSWWVAAP